MQVRVGVDVADAQQVAASVDRFGERYLRRVFTPTEIADCRTSAGGVKPDWLAARFAAKEAAVKMLRPMAQTPQWRSMEIVREPNGAPVLALHGDAARLAEQASVVDMSVSMTHEGDLATAVVVALLDPPELQPEAAGEANHV